MERKEINARLEAVRAQLAALSVEVLEISAAAPYKLGSRVSYVYDRIQQTIEEINACLEFPERWRVEEQAGTVTVWDTASAFGFRFAQGDRLAAYTLTVITPPDKLSTAEGLQELNTVQAEFLEWARENFPGEFTTEVHQIRRAVRICWPCSISENITLQK